MTSSISWIDRDGLAETLSRLGMGGRPQRVLNSPAPETEPMPVERLSLEPSLDTRPSPIPFVPPAGPLRERLDAFIDWLMRLCGSRVAFIVDRDGLPLVDRHAEADLLAIASSVMQLIERINRKLLSVVGQAVTIQLEDGQLILLSVTTPIGEYIVGQVGTLPPDRETQQAAAEALQAAFQPSLDADSIGG